MIRPFILLFCLLVLTQFAQAQQTLFDANGNIIEMKFDASQKLVAPIQTALDPLDADKRAAARKALKKQVDATIKNLEDPTTGLADFYKDVWTTAGEYDLVLKGLKEMSVYLDKPANTLSNTTYFLTLYTDAKKWTVDEKLYHFNTDNELWQKLPMNNLLIEYYNHLQADINNRPIIQVSNANWKKYTDFLVAQSKQATDLIATYQQNPTTSSVALYQSLRGFHEDLDQDAITGELKSWFNLPWFRACVWMHSGLPKNNPVDFTTELFLKSYPQYDPYKSGKYEEYIDSVVARYLRYDTVGKLEQFRKILGEKGSGPDQFKYAARQKAIADNLAAGEKLLTAERLLNKIELPEIKDEDFSLKREKNKVSFYNYTWSKKASGKFAASNNITAFQTAPLGSGEIKKLVIHNIPAGADVIMKSKKTVIVDQSEFQQVVDTVLDMAVIAAANLTQLSTFANLLNIVRVAPNNAINLTTTKDIAYNKTTIGFESLVRASEGGIPKALTYVRNSKTVGTVVEETLNSLMLYDARLFASFGADAAIHARLSAPYTGDAQEGELVKLVDSYKRLLEQQQLNMFNLVRADSLRLSFMSQAFVSSSMPPGELTLKKDETAQYHSKVVETEPSDDPVKMDVMLSRKSTTDSSQLVHISYRIGRRYRFQPVAAVAYTIGDIVRSHAKEQNGTVNIENTSERYQFYVGVHVHFGRGILLQDNRFLGHFADRASFVVGVGVPKPLENIYVGFGYDLVPGLKASIGAHLYAVNKYNIENNAITEERASYRAALFVSVGIDPVSLIKSLNIFK
jgi:hypothetical protein